MPDEALESELRFELRAAGVRWQKTYAVLGDTARRELVEKMRTSREQKAELEEEMRRKRALPEPEDEAATGYYPECLGGVGTLNHGSGGGRRVIRSTRGLGG